uniref:Uncharacterized protein n=1 Tax=Echeneis naucrates TaxID=173247 RepID=A0A665T2U9_ECHNA
NTHRQLAEMCASLDGLRTGSFACSESFVRGSVLWLGNAAVHFIYLFICFVFFRHLSLTPLFLAPGVLPYVSLCLRSSMVPNPPTTLPSCPATPPHLLHGHPSASFPFGYHFVTKKP